MGATSRNDAITAGPAGKPALAWHFDQDAIDAEAAADGWYALLTNLAPAQAGPAEVFRRYKGHPYPETPLLEDLLGSAVLPAHRPHDPR